MLTIGLIASIIVIWIGHQNDRLDDVEASLLTYIGIFFITIILLLYLAGITCISQGSMVQSRLDRYEHDYSILEQNLKIEIEYYIEEEYGTTTSVEDKDILLVAVMYPNIKENYIIKTQMDEYIYLTKEIKELRNQIDDIKIWRWWVYFG